MNLFKTCLRQIRLTKAHLKQTREDIYDTVKLLMSVLCHAFQTNLNTNPYKGI